MKVGIDYIKPWKWRSIYKARKALRELGQLVVLKRKYQRMMDTTKNGGDFKIFKAKHTEVSTIITARLRAFNFRNQ